VSDRFNSLTVVLDRDLLAEEAQPLVDAIMQLRGVIRVEPLVADPVPYAHRAQLLRQVQDRLVLLVRDLWQLAP
jgi:hypothetical protein